MKKKTPTDRLKMAFGGDPDPRPKLPIDPSGTFVNKKTKTDYEYNLIHDLSFLAADPNNIHSDIGKGFLSIHSPNTDDPNNIRKLITDITMFNQDKEYASLKGKDRIEKYFSLQTADPYIKSLKTNKAYNPMTMMYNSPDVNVQQQFAAGGVAGGGWGTLAQQAPAIMDGVINILENNPNAYSKQPTMNASTMRNMVNPYSNFAVGGVVPIEAEGQEVVQTPDGAVGQLQGPSHEQGGMDMNVPAGTKIYSDRLKLDGKTMQQRKLKRERQLEKISKLLEASPADKILKNTVNRTKTVLELEDAQDMAIQNAAQEIYSGNQKFAVGGEVPPSYADYMNRRYVTQPINIPFEEGYMAGMAPNVINQTPGINTDLALNGRVGNPLSSGIDTSKALAGTGGPDANLAGVSGSTPAAGPQAYAGQLTAGDYVGMAGSLFAGVAPLINTLNNRKGDKPNINRFLGYGHEALDVNQDSQDYVDQMRSHQLTDLDTSVNAQAMGNRNSAQSVNTLRALDSITAMGKQKAKNSINDSFSNQMLGLLGQRTQLLNDKDAKEMQGEMNRDVEDKADRDAFFTAKGENLSNLGTQVQNLGRSFNISHSNKVDSKLISQLSKYGLDFDEDGNLISKKG